MLQAALQDLQSIDASTSSIRTTVEFTSLDSLSAARRERQRGRAVRVAILDAANRSDVGGVGMSPYAGTQEEDLIRTSNLYYLLSPRHNKHMRRQCEQMFGSGWRWCHIPYFGCVLLPGVSFLDEDARNTSSFDVIACAFPNLRSSSDEWRQYFHTATRSEIEHLIMCKVEAVLCAAVRLRCQSLVLAAIGCGYFAGGNPRLVRVLEPSEPRLAGKQAMARMVGTCFAEALRGNWFRNRFERVVFAIAYDETLLSEFKNAFEQRFNLS